MSRLTKVCLAGALLAGALGIANGALVHAGNLNQAKVRRGAWVVPVAPPAAPISTKASVRPPTPRPSPLELRLVPAGSQADVGRAPIAATPGQPVALSLLITNNGPATEVRLTSVGHGVTVTIPRAVTVEANAVTAVDVEASVADCSARPRALQILAHEGPTAAPSAQTVVARVACY